MAAQCAPSSAATMMIQQQQQQHNSFISSSGYYGYVPLRLRDNIQDAMTSDLVDIDMDVDQHHNNYNNGTQTTFGFLANGVDERRRFGQKRSLLTVHDDLTASCMPRLKKFREGDYLWPAECGLAQMYNEPSLLCLSPAADFDMACQPTTMTGNLKFQSTAAVSRINNTRSQEFEDMLLMTHGCSSYHHYRHTQLSQATDIEEAEF